ncbi:unnamed protein product, partial [Didymodactylos carnosus]
NQLNLTKIFRLTNLKYLSLLSENGIIPKFDELQLSSYKHPSSIEYLTIKNSGFHFSELRSLFAYMPKLKYLELNLIKPLSSISANSSQQPSFVIPQDLKEIKLKFNVKLISTKEIISLLTQVTKLEKLTVNIQYGFDINEISIETLFWTSLPLLKSCRISFTDTLFGRYFSLNRLLFKLLFFELYSPKLFGGRSYKEKNVGAISIYKINYKITA